jgi:hypothetical protein
VALRSDGQPCRVSQNLGQDGRCLWHDPARAQEAAATRAKGQRNARAKHQLAVVTKDEMPPLNTLEDCAEFCAWVAYAVGDGRIAHQVAKEMISAVKERRYILVIAADVHRRVRDVRQRVAANAKELAV